MDEIIDRTHCRMLICKVMSFL